MLETSTSAQGAGTPCKSSTQQAHLVPALVQNWHNQHWVAYRWGHDGTIYRLDSMDIGPHRMSDEEFEASLAAHLTYAITHPSDA